jgi:hypothetical protein
VRRHETLRDGRELPGAGVAREPRVGAARDLQPEPGARPEPVRHAVEFESYDPRCIRAGIQPEQRVTHVPRPPFRVDLAQPGEDIRVRVVAGVREFHHR